MKKPRRLSSPSPAVRGFARPSVAAEPARALASPPTASTRDLAFELRMAEHQLSEARLEIARLRELAYVDPRDESPSSATWKEQAQTLDARLSVHEPGGAKALSFEWLQESHDCETCGPSWAAGALVLLNGQVLVDRTPCAACFDGRDYSPEQVYSAVLAALGYEVAQKHTDLDEQEPDEPEELKEGGVEGAADSTTTL